MSWLDRLRTQYVKAPPLVRRAAGHLVSLVPVERRFGAAYLRVRADLQRARGDGDFVERYQREKLDALLAACATRSSHYRRVFESLGLPRPRAEDLARLPVLTRDDVRGHEDELLVRPRETLDVVTTSGSSGQPLTLYLDRDRSVLEWAFLNHIWSRIGYRPGDVRATIRYTFAPRANERQWEYDLGLRELRLAPFHLTPEVMDDHLLQIRRHRVQFLHGYPSTLMSLAIHAMRARWQPSESLRGILPISEVMYESQRRLAAAAFGPLPVQPVYGMSEKVAIAGECGEPFTYEFEPLYGITELLDDAGHPVRPGERGRVVGTGFICPSMPLVRYDTGDRAVLVEPATRENGWRLKAKNPSSVWVAEFLVGRTGAPMALTTLVFPHHAYDLIRAFQYYQDTPGLAVMRVVPLPGVTADDLRPLVEEMTRWTDGALEIRIELVKELVATSRGKQKHVDQRLAIEGRLVGETEMEPDT